VKHFVICGTLTPNIVYCDTHSDVCLPTLNTWGLAVRKSMIQVHRGVFRPSSISLPGSLLGTMMLKAELKSINILT